MPDDLLDRCRRLCPDFVARGPTRRGRKSEVIDGEVAAAPVIAKRTRSASPVWAWYSAREIALYRALALQPLPVRTPRLVAADDEVLVIERIAGAPLASKRRPHVELDAVVLDRLLATMDVLETIEAPQIDVPAPTYVRSQMRERLLEDPTSDGAWIRDGILRCAQRGLIDNDVARRAHAAIESVPVVFAHGDMLLRNAISEGSVVVLVDWECAGAHVRDWDRALLWTQLGTRSRERVEASIEDRDRLAAFRSLVVFALARELRFVRAFGRDDDAVRDDLTRAIERR